MAARLSFTQLTGMSTLPDQSTRSKADPFPIVALGGSAGALDVLVRFFHNVDPEQRIAYVVVVHLAPASVSHLAQLLATHIRLPVAQIVDGEELVPHRVHVIPPNVDLTLVDRVFQ